MRSAGYSLANAAIATRQYWLRPAACRCGDPGRSVARVYGAVSSRSISTLLGIRVAEQGACRCRGTHNRRFARVRRAWVGLRAWLWIRREALVLWRRHRLTWSAVLAGTELDRARVARPCQTREI